MTAEDLTDWLENAIMESIDLDWVPRDAATLIVSRMQAEGLVMAPAQPAANVTGRCKVPVGQTPLDNNLGHRLLDVIREGSNARDGGTGSPYHGHSLEHCLYATGWVQRDLRLALDAAPAHPAADLVEAAAKVHCDYYGGEGWWDDGFKASEKPKALEAMRAALSRYAGGA